ncbi:unnamed protein product [Lampetra fluviatilis]
MVDVPASPAGGDSLLSLSLVEWGRLQMADSSLLALRCRAGGPEEGRTRAGSWLRKQGLLMRKTHRTDECDREENHDDSGQQASGGEEEETPAPEDPSSAPNERLEADAGLRHTHSRLAELLLAAASILAEITTSGGARTSTDIERAHHVL